MTQIEALERLKRWRRIGFKKPVSRLLGDLAGDWARETYLSMLQANVAAVQADMGETMHEVIIIEARNLTHVTIEALEIPNEEQ